VNTRGKPVFSKCELIFYCGRTMLNLVGKKVLLGITGSVAAYKSAELVRLLGKAGAEVQVVMTQSAAEFIAPMTLQALSGRPVRQTLFDAAHEAAMGHIELARWADLILIAPASAHLVAKLAAGLADDLLSTLCLASAVPMALAPAMNQQMWHSEATQTNIATLVSRGVLIWGPAEGGQACGETGAGRMEEPEALANRVGTQLSSGVLQGCRVLLTAGPTREPLDPVRFIGNRSSGKMGFALAEALRNRGAEVILVAGPVSLNTPSGVERIDVESAQDMLEAVEQHVDSTDLFVACAAVADYRPVGVAKQKIKKSQEELEIRLVRNRDILASVAGREPAPFTVGFAAETEQHIEYAEKKRLAKGVDMIAANLVGGAKGGFERDENALTVLWGGGRQELPMDSKAAVAGQLVELIVERYEQRD